LLRRSKKIFQATQLFLAKLAQGYMPGTGYGFEAINRAD